jgi:hypothetical protein
METSPLAFQGHLQPPPPRAVEDVSPGDAEAPGPFGWVLREGHRRRRRRRGGGGEGRRPGLAGARRAGGASSGLTVRLNWVKAKLNTEALCAN